MENEGTYKIWVKRDIPYRTPSFDYRQTSFQDRSSLRQCVNLYLPMHSWNESEQIAINKQINSLSKRCWKSESQRKQESSYMDIQMVGSRPIICYSVGGSWMMGNRGQRNVHDILKTFCRNLNAICVSIGYRVCRLRSRYIDLTLLGMCVNVNIFFSFIFDRDVALLLRGFIACFW